MKEKLDRVFMGGELRSQLFQAAKKLLEGRDHFQLNHIEIGELLVRAQVEIKAPEKYARAARTYTSSEGVGFRLFIDSQHLTVPIVVNENAMRAHFPTVYDGYREVVRSIQRKAAPDRLEMNKRYLKQELEKIFVQEAERQKKRLCPTNQFIPRFGRSPMTVRGYLKNRLGLTPVREDPSNPKSRFLWSEVQVNAAEEALQAALRSPAQPQQSKTALVPVPAAALSAADQAVQEMHLDLLGMRDDLKSIGQQVATALEQLTSEPPDSNLRERVAALENDVSAKLTAQAELINQLIEVQTLVLAELGHRATKQLPITRGSSKTMMKSLVEISRIGDKHLPKF